MTSLRPAQILRREAGFALALLALWVLVLLLPLHQTAGLLRQMAAAGHDISGAWSICITLADEDGTQDHSQPLCPVQGIGKDSLGTPPAPVTLAATLLLPRDLRPASLPAPAHVAARATLPQPRAPPGRA